MCPLNDNCSCHEDDWTADPDHMCTDWELCPTCRPCIGCCTGGDDHPPASSTSTTTGKAT